MILCNNKNVFRMEQIFEGDEMENFDFDTLKIYFFHYGDEIFFLELEVMTTPGTKHRNLRFVMPTSLFPHYCARWAQEGN
jgi:hypothetical protein